MRAVAIVPAAGQGARLRTPGQPSKQFRGLGGRPVLVRTMEALDRHPDVAALVVAVPGEQQVALRDELARYAWRVPVEVVAGGASRQESVARALAAVGKDAALILVHDAVRPFLSQDRLDAVLRAGGQTGAAALAIPVADTLRAVADARFGVTVDRTGLWQMQTPQVFHAHLLRRALAAAGPAVATDEVELVLRSGAHVTRVEGSALNFKVTTAEDWRLAQMLWPAWERELRAND